ncbi:UPF0280 family protein [Pseudothermotoga sp.]|nr:UPF0280 family protein [Pseudothermotoga sp.]MCX7813028.1 UPF0280 family protein [Pseudothermotoga sp.]MDW8139733.1 UPF0280 family protein [Pseudothermotoga sp.]
MKKFYRDWCSGRFQSFVVQYRETDLWIGVDEFEPSMPNAVLELLKALYQQLLEVGRSSAEFFTSLEPVKIDRGPKIAMKMIEAASFANVGPTAAVAGAFADEVGEFLLNKFKCREVVVENGGDVFIKCEKPLISMIYAGDSPLSGKVGLQLPEGTWGVCTSSGKVGHSLSFGNADAVTVVSKSSAIADAFATAYCNRVKSKRDVTALLETAINEHVLGVVVIFEDVLGVKGQFKIVFDTDGDEDETGR